MFVRTIYMQLRDTTLWATQLYIPVQTNLISSLQQALQSLQVDFTQEYFWAIFGMLGGGGRGGWGTRKEWKKHQQVIRKYGWKRNLTLGVDQKNFAIL